MSALYWDLESREAVLCSYALSQSDFLIIMSCYFGLQEKTKRSKGIYTKLKRKKKCRNRKEKTNNHHS